MGELKTLLDRVCPNCGFHADELINYINQYNGTPEEDILEEEINLLDTAQKEYLCNILLGTGYNIFNYWYYNMLIGIKDECPRAQEILEANSDGFNRIIS